MSGFAQTQQAKLLTIPCLRFPLSVPVSCVAKCRPKWGVVLAVFLAALSWSASKKWPCRGCESRSVESVRPGSLESSVDRYSKSLDSFCGARIVGTCVPCRPLSIMPALHAYLGPYSADPLPRAPCHPPRRLDISLGTNHSRRGRSVISAQVSASPNKIGPWQVRAVEDHLLCIRIPAAQCLDARATTPSWLSRDCNRSRIPQHQVQSSWIPWTRLTPSSTCHGVRSRINAYVWKRPVGVRRDIVVGEVFPEAPVLEASNCHCRAGSAHIVASHGLCMLKSCLRAV